MKLINVAVTTLKDVVIPVFASTSSACLDACKCTDPDACREQF